MMNRLSGIVLGIAIVLTSGIPIWAGTPPVEAVFPPESQSGFILRFEDLPKEIRSKKLLFNLNEEGRPFVLVDNTLIALQDKTGVPSLSLKIPGLETVDHFAWTHDGALLVVAGPKLGVVTREGFNVLISLPANGMKIEPASTEGVYLYGGDSPSQQRNVYLYKKGGKLLQLLRAPSPIQAISGDGDLTFVALGKSIYVLAMGKPLTLVYEIDDEVTSLAMAPPSGLFYSSEKKVGYITQRGKGYTFLRGRGAELKVRSEVLYLLFRDEGIMKCFPVSSFDRLADSLEKAGD